MDDLVAVSNLPDQILGFQLIHFEYFLYANFVGLTEVFEFSLQICELLGQLLVLDCQVFVCLLSFDLLFVITFDYFALNFFLSAFFILVTFKSGFVNSNLFLEHTVVKIQLLFIKFVDSFHVFHALFKNLHFFFQFDLWFSLGICIIVADLFKFSCKFLFLLSTSGFEVRLNVFMFFEQLLYFLSVVLKHFTTLRFKCCLNVLELILIRGAKVFERTPHMDNHLINIIVHWSHGLDVFLVLALESFHELINQLLFISDNLFAFILLNVDFLNTKQLRLSAANLSSTLPSSLKLYLH